MVCWLQCRDEGSVPTRKCFHACGAESSKWPDKQRGRFCEATLILVRRQSQQWDKYIWYHSEFSGVNSLCWPWETPESLVGVSRWQQDWLPWEGKQRPTADGWRWTTRFWGPTTAALIKSYGNKTTPSCSMASEPPGFWKVGVNCPWASLAMCGAWFFCELKHRLDFKSRRPEGFLGTTIPYKITPIMLHIILTLTLLWTKKPLLIIVIQCSDHLHRTEGSTHAWIWFDSTLRKALSAFVPKYLHITSIPLCLTFYFCPATEPCMSWVTLPLK